MKYYIFRLFLFGILGLGVASVLQSCEVKFYEDCPSDRIIGDWGVVNHSHTFGEYDSIYYIINPIGNINDSVYYNGNYIDSYYHSDPVRVLMRYTLSDSIQFNLDRLYTTESNPVKIIMNVSNDEKDLLHKKDEEKGELTCVLHLTRDDDNGNLYSCGPDSLFKELLREGKLLYIKATNTPTSAEAQGSQVYEFTINPAGFEEALHLADSLTLGSVKYKVK